MFIYKPGYHCRRTILPTGDRGSYMDINEEGLEESLLGAFDNLSYLPDIASLLYDIKLLLNKIYDEVSLSETEEIYVQSDRPINDD